MCKHPYWNQEEQIWCPCGSCAYCRKAKTSEWSVRVVHELKYHDKAILVTLTYDDDHLPPLGSLRHSDFQGYMKLVRYYFRDIKLSYFMCGEYGTKRGRPHYHAIIFGVGFGMPADDLSKLVTSWKHGQVDVGYNISQKTGAYVAGYITKKLKTKEYGELVPPYIKCSKGLGKRYAQEASEIFLFDGCIKPATTLADFPIPRYYFKVLGVNRKEYYEDYVIQRNQELFDIILDRVGPDNLIIITTDEFDTYVKASGKIYKSLEYKLVKEGKYLKLSHTYCLLKGKAFKVWEDIRLAHNRTIEAQLREKERGDL